MVKKIKWGTVFFPAILLVLWGVSLAQAQPKTHTNSIGMEFVLIQAGSFMMGADPNFEETFDHETPRHKVTISKPFYMGKHEVTQEQWVAVMGSNPSKFKGRSNPVEQVSWDDVQRFIAELNQKENTDQYSLPTEAQWEYACRAGNSSTYSFGDDKNRLGQYAWYDGNSGEETHPVGQLKPNAWGLYDMYGNVWEWCGDWYGGYSSGSVTDPQGSSSGSYRVLRGGSWINSAGGCRSANRLYSTPGYRNFVGGFRLVRHQFSR